MKRWIAFAMLLLFVGALLSGCDKKPAAPSEPASSAASSDAPVSSEAPSSSSPEPGSGTESSALSNQDESSEAFSSEESSEPESSGEVNQTEHENSLLPAIETDNEDFLEKFSGNSLDMAYEEEMRASYSAVQWVNICGKYAELWNNEADRAYRELLAVVSEERYSSLRQEQEEWRSEIAVQVDTLQAAAAAEGGSAAMFNAASEILIAYRARAAALYEELYPYQPDFSFSFKANG